jgi:hypothetical protein
MDWIVTYNLLETASLGDAAGAVGSCCVRLPGIPGK